MLTVQYHVITIFINHDIHIHTFSKNHCVVTAHVQQTYYHNSKSYDFIITAYVQIDHL